MNRARNTNRSRDRRGTALIAALLLLMMATLIVTGLMQSGARDQDLSVRRIDTVQTFYAAESGMQMAIMEMACSCDGDGDGTIGTISDNGNDADDPGIGTAQVVVTSTTVGQEMFLYCDGRAGLTLRSLEVTLK